MFFRKKKKIKEAFDLGEKSAQSFMDEVTIFIDLRSKKISENFLKIFINQIEDSKKQEKYPAIDVCRADYSILEEQVIKVKKTLSDEAKLFMHKWDDINEKMGCKPDFDKAIEEYASMSLDGILLSAADFIEHNIDEIKAADASWREKHPEK